MGIVSYAAMAVVAMLAVYLVFVSIGKYQQPRFVGVKVGNATISAEVADTGPKQVRGLMFRDSLPKDGGMLFTFGSEGSHGIWMMNMSMPIDIVWLDKGRKVVTVMDGVPPCGALAVCPVYYPGSKDMYVLELAAGYAKRHGIKVGSKASFSGY